MKRVALLVLAGLAGMSGCASRQGEPAVVSPATQSQREALLDRMKSLEGEWRAPHPETGEMMTASVFKTTSNGSVVREVMFPGSDHEMTNMYHMDGGSMVVTHYCAVGNQPRMRATGAEGNAIRFEFDSVTNKTSPGQTCMGDLTIEFVDADHIVERWNTIGNEEEHATVFELTRKR